MSNAQSTFQLNTRKLFLTYPQCPVPKERARDFFEVLLNPKEYVIAHELHANGDDHLHCYFELDNPYRTRSPTALDLIIDSVIYHGNYQGCRSDRNVLKYCTKLEDYVSNIDVASKLASKSNRRAIAKKLLDGELSLEESIEQYPELVWSYHTLKANLGAIAAVKKRSPPLSDFLENPWGKLLPTNIAGKKRHFWIWSAKPDVGKTYKFAKPLAAKYCCNIYTTFDDWPGIVADQRLLILDDYNFAALKWNVINQIADNTYGFKQKYQPTCQPDSYLVVIISNSSINDLYPNKNEFIHARFNELNVDI